MKMICVVKPYKFEEKFLLLALENDETGMFEDMEFDVYFYENRLCIRSQEMQK